MKRFQLILGVLVLVFGTNLDSFAASDIQIPVNETTTLNKGPLGVWDYEVEGTEDAYRKGVLFVRLENGKHFVEVHLGNGVLNGQDVQLKGDTLKFIVNLDGVERVAIVLQSKEDSIIGEASSSQGNFTIRGTRKLPPQ